MGMHGSAEQPTALSVLQDWTKQENEDAEGVVSFSYRTKPEEPPDVQTIQKQMAIVAWQPGPNRIVQVPSQVSTTTTTTYLQHLVPISMKSSQLSFLAQ